MDLSHRLQAEELRADPALSDQTSWPRRALNTCWRYIGHGLTAVALVLDRVLSPVVDPVQDWLSRQSYVNRTERWIAGLPPYGVLAMVAGPVIVRQSVKFLAIIVMATENPLVGGVLYIASRIANILLVKRIYEAGRDKLLTIDWVETAHDWVDRRSDRRLESFRKTALHDWMQRRLGIDE